MKSSEIRKRLHHYIDRADEKKKIKAIFTMVEEEIEESYEHWDDDNLINELKEQEDKYLKGQLKITLLTNLFQIRHQLLKK